ncbi:hypothetical protein [uncultured Tateyamaria sp.]|uniref:carboxymuconolactone decarboxylase family protein n=1 Tax=uncultured Tateyamaria sp. TaxID=455651 RepID=UPI0026265BDC|nr:hypothetical protein [uncultured Tateyamaria sp.]
MTGFSGLSKTSSLSDVLQRFPRHSERLLRLLDVIMCDDGALGRGEREAIAAFVSQQTTTPYCVIYHTVFSEAFSGPIAATNESIRPLLTYAGAVLGPDRDRISAAFDAARHAGWSEDALHEVVEVCGLFSLINTIVRAAGIDPPKAISPQPTADGLARAYAAMADAIPTQDTT